MVWVLIILFVKFLKCHKVWFLGLCIDFLVLYSVFIVVLDVNLLQDMYRISLILFLHHWCESPFPYVPQTSVFLDSI